MSDMFSSLSYLANKELDESRLNHDYSESDTAPIQKEIPINEMRKISIGSLIHIDDTASVSQKQDESPNPLSFFSDSGTTIAPSNSRYMVGEFEGVEHLNDLNSLSNSNIFVEVDDYLDDLVSSDNLDNESLELKNSLLSMGRKYARDTKTSANESEIQKSFSSSEKNLKEIFDEIDKDKVLINKDIHKIRGGSRNSKLLSDLVGIKNQYISTQLSIIKEMNSIQKTKFDLQSKRDKAEAATSSGIGSADISSNTIRNLFSNGRDALVNAMGGYGSASGAVDTGSISESDYTTSIDNDVYYSNIINDICEKDESFNSDGDGYLKYEDSGAELVLLIDSESNPVDIFAEDRDGNILNDYPIPDNFKELHFEIDKSTSSATDQLYRNYVVRSE